MSDIKISIGGVGGPGQLPSLDRLTGKESDAGFEKVMQEAVAKLNQVQQDSEKAVHELASGGDVTQAIIDMEKADMNFQLMIEVRNKLIAAYQEIQRMQV